MEYLDYIGLLQGCDKNLAIDLASFNTLENVLDWMTVRKIPLSAIEVIFQDEYSHDVVIPLQEDGRHLVFGITWLGGLTAVAVWPKKPSANELLERRIRDGWEPTPSQLKEGPKILGHASCLAATLKKNS